MRKKLLKSHPDSVTSPRTTSPGGGLDVAELATVLVSSETPGHPVENAFDGQRGPGASRWVSETVGEQTIILAFDAPQRIKTVDLEIEETDQGRTQELQLAVSRDGGQTYSEVLRQEFNFAPEGATFEHEEWALEAEAVTHLRLRIKPDKGNQLCRASLTALVLR